MKGRKENFEQERAILIEDSLDTSKQICNENGIFELSKSILTIYAVVNLNEAASQFALARFFTS